MAASIAVALIQSRLDYAVCCGVVCYIYGISAGNLAKLQRFQNFAARSRIVAHHQSKGPASSHLSGFLLNIG